jgi:hypothetical protein
LRFVVLATRAGTGKVHVRDSNGADQRREVLE